MPRAYSGDLRERALAAYEAGEGSQSAVARRYRVGERTLSGWLKAAREEGRRAPRPRHGGRAPLGGEREALAGLVSRSGTTPPWPSTPTCWPSARACGAAPPPCAGR
jgi:transposase-like protein